MMNEKPENKILRFLLSPTLWITILFVVTGTINTLSVKWSNKLMSKAEDNSEPEFFRHPHLQTWGMFLGESLCLLVYLAQYAYLRLRGPGNENGNPYQNGGVRNSPLVQESSGYRLNGVGGNIEGANEVPANAPGQMQKFNPLILLPAAMLDLCGTSIMYVGLTLTSASSFQMLRGSVIVFTGILSRYEF